MTVMKHSYWIPTNRNARNSLLSYVNEIDYLFKSSNKNIPFFLLDSGDESIEIQNAELVRDTQIQYPHLSLNHVTLAQQRKIVVQLLKDANLPGELLELIAPTGINYGAVMNKISLFAALLNSNIIHRRDSDTSLQEHCPSPLEFEVLSLGLNEKDADKKNYIAGSGYVGEWNLDLKPFLNVSADLFYTFWSCLDVDKSLHSSIYNWIESGSRAIYKGDSVSTANTSGFYLPEAGNVAIYQLHLMFPSLPSNAMSSDYSLFRLARSFNLPVLFHERRVVHEYHSGRKKNPLPYIMSLVKYCDLRPVYAALEKEINLGLAAGTIIFEQEPHLHVASLLADIARRDIRQREEKLAYFIKNFIARLYPEEAEQLLGSVSFILEECCQDYANHVQLLRSWQRLIDVALKSESQIASQLFQAPDAIANIR